MDNKSKERLEEIKQNLVDMGLEEKYNKAGIYSISIGNEIVYIGKSKNMLSRIASHILEIEYDRPQANKYKVLHEALNSGYRIKFDVLQYADGTITGTIEDDLGELESFYIRTTLPVLNYQIPRADNWHRYTVNKLASTIKLEDIVEVKAIA